MREIGALLAYEVTRDPPLDDVEIETPLGAMQAQVLEGKKLCLVSILRAGIGILDGMLDPMLATGNSAVAAVRRPKDHGAAAIKFVCVVAAPEGVGAFNEARPDVPVFTAAVDLRLNDHGYIVPGLGDAGDRLYGTK